MAEFQPLAEVAGRPDAPQLVVRKSLRTFSSSPLAKGTRLLAILKKEGSLIWTFGDRLLTSGDIRSQR
jgi:hypothetical protein